MLEIPNKAIFEQQAKNGLTKQSYAHVCSLIEQINQAEDEFRQLMQRASEICTPYDTFPGDIEALAPLSVLKLHRLTGARTPVFQYGKTRTEMYLIEQWQKGLEAWKKQMDRVKQAIEQCC